MLFTPSEAYALLHLCAVLFISAQIVLVFSVSDKQKASYEETPVNKNITKSTITAPGTYLEWAYKKIKLKDTKNLALEDFDEVLKDFYTELEKKDGRNYEPDSLGLLPTSLDYPLKNKGDKGSIVRGRKFGKSNKKRGDPRPKTLRHEGKKTV